MNHSLFTGNTSFYLVAPLNYTRYLYNELAIWSINGFKKQTKKNTFSFCVVFLFFPNPVKPTFPEAGKGFSRLFSKSHWEYYISPSWRNMCMVGFKPVVLSDPQGHGIRLHGGCNFTVVIWRQQMLHQWNFWNGKFLRPNPGLVSVATLDLSSVQEWRTEHEVHENAGLRRLQSQNTCTELVVLSRGRCRSASQLFVGEDV